MTRCTQQVNDTIAAKLGKLLVPSLKIHDGNYAFCQPFVFCELSKMVGTTMTAYNLTASPLYLNKVILSEKLN